MYNLSHLIQKPQPIVPYHPPQTPVLPAIAHCGTWHAITTLPACCGRCGAVVLREEG